MERREAAEKKIHTNSAEKKRKNYKLSLFFHESEERLHHG